MRWFLGCIGVALCTNFVLAAEPGDQAEPVELQQLKETTSNLIRLLVDQGVLTPEKAEAIVREAQDKAKHAAEAKREMDARQPAAAQPADGKTPGKPSAGNVVRVPYVPESVKREIRDQIKEEVLSQAKAERWGEPGAVPEWIDNLKWEGDLRLRMDKTMFPKGNTSVVELESLGVNIDNSSVDRDRLRVRARLSLLAKVNDQWSAGFRLATGNLNDPVSTNQTLGNSFNKASVLFDRAYVKYDPYPWLSVAGGRIANPWFSTDLVWDEDLNFEGIAASMSRELGEGRKAHATVGVFPLDEVNLSSKDKWLFGAQGILDWDFASRYQTRFGLALYEYRNIVGKRNNVGSKLNDFTAPEFRQKGNSVFDIRNDQDTTTALYALASDYREVNLTASLTMRHFDPLYLNLTGDIVKNIGFDAGEVQSRKGERVEDQTLGYQARLTFGRELVRDRNEWQVFATYRHLERDAVLDAFTDSDFHLGGTDAKGFILGGSYGLDKNAWLTARWFSADEIDGPRLGIDTLFVDLNVRF